MIELQGADAEVNEYYPGDIYETYTISQRHKTCLHLAIQYRHFDVVKLSLGHGADPLERNPQGQTPLYLVLVSGHDKIIESLSSYIQNFPNYLVYAEE